MYKADNIFTLYQSLSIIFFNVSQFGASLSITEGMKTQKRICVNKTGTVLTDKNTATVNMVSDCVWAEFSEVMFKRKSRTSVKIYCFMFHHMAHWVWQTVLPSLSSEWVAKHIK